MAAATAIRHRPKIERTPRSTEDGKALYGYQFRCTCGQSGQEHVSRRMAEWDVNEHVKALPRVPADQQCQMPRTHGRKFWEPCLLCADQLPLFETGASA